MCLVFHNPVGFLLLFVFHPISYTADRCWVVGDSIIRWAGEGNPQLMGTGQTIWLGLSGARILGLQSRLNRLLAGRSAPQTLIIHLGTNDVFQLSQYELCRAAESALRFVRQRLPHCRVVWSSILPRLFWYGESLPGVGDRVRRVVNRRATRVCETMPGDNRVIRNNWLSVRDHSLFRRDGIHLSGRGNIQFRNHLEAAIQHFNAHNSEEAPHFPP